jgi:hypothetical protein
LFGFLSSDKSAIALLKYERLEGRSEATGGDAPPIALLFIAFLR